MLSDSVPVSEGEPYGDFVNGLSDHVTYWPTIQRQRPGLRHYEYEQVPRGRVIYSTREDQFVVLGSKAFIASSKEKDAVIKQFNLQGQTVRFRSDSHYAPVPGMLGQ